MSRLSWTSPPGGKRYTAHDRGRTLTVTRMNTATGALPWKATVELADGRVFVAGSTKHVGDAKAAAEAWDRA